MTCTARPGAAPDGDEQTRRRAEDLRGAARECGVIWAGMYLLGVGFGIVVVGHGLAWWLAPIISGTVFAGSLEFLLVGLFATAAPLGTIALTTLLVNSRHLFYGLSFPLHRVHGRARRAYSIFALCDEAYAVVTAKDPDSVSGARISWTQLGMHGSWASGSLTGALVGSALLHDLRGLDFILTALFIVLSIDAFRAGPDMRTLALAVGSAAVALLVAPGAMLPIALTLLTAGLLVRHRRGRATRSKESR